MEIDWNIVGVILTALATIGLVVIGFRQTKIQKTQTNIQNKALKTSLLEQRLQCLHDINNTRSSFLIPRELANRISFYNTGSGGYSISDNMKAQDISISNFIRAVEDTKYLFSKYHYDYLKTMIGDISYILAIYKEVLFKTILIDNSNNNEFYEKRQKIESLRNHAISTNEILEKELMEVLEIDYNQYLEITNRLIEKFSNEEFFATFDEYLDIAHI